MNLSPAPACVYAFPSQASAMAPVQGLEAKLRLCWVVPISCCLAAGRAQPRAAR